MHIDGIVCRNGVAWWDLLLVLLSRFPDKLGPNGSSNHRRPDLRLKNSRESREGTLAGITEEDARKSPGPGRWSAVECVEHLTIAEQATARAAQERRAAGGAHPFAGTRGPHGGERFRPRHSRAGAARRHAHGALRIPVRRDRAVSQPRAGAPSNSSRLLPICGRCRLRIPFSDRSPVTNWPPSWPHTRFGTPYKFARSANRLSNM